MRDEPTEESKEDRNIILDLDANEHPVLAQYLLDAEDESDASSSDASRRRLICLRAAAQKLLLQSKSSGVCAGQNDIEEALSHVSPKEMQVIRLVCDILSPYV